MKTFLATIVACHLSLVALFGYTTEQYGTADDGAPLYQDVYVPAGSGPWPTVIVIHGGGFYGGSRHGENIPQCCADLAGAGFLAKSIDYRLAPPGSIDGQTSSGRYPMQTDDVTKAVIAARGDTIRGNGRVLGLGGSAGGTHVVVAAAIGTDGYDKLDAAVALSGPFDFADRTVYWNVNAFVNSVARYCGTHNINILRADSPVEVVDSQTHPLLLVNTEIDNVDQSQTNDLIALLNPSQYQVILLPGSGHSFHYWSEVKDDAIAFLEAQL